MSALALPACLAGPALASDQVYKSIDADGHVVYSDRASTPAAEKTDIHVNRPDAAEVAQYAKEQQILKAEDDQRRKQFAAEAADAQKKSQAEHARETQCENARSRNDAIQGGRRIYSNDADGNRVYLSGRTRKPSGRKPVKPWRLPADREAAPGRPGRHRLAARLSEFGSGANRL